MSKLNVNEIFLSLQGEGKYAGTPCIFVRTSKCTRSCSYCDTKYHSKGKAISDKDLCLKIINTSKASEFVEHIVWTGGEPLLQLEDLCKVIPEQLHSYKHSLESNGDLITEDNINSVSNLFNYICISPKEKSVAKRIFNLRSKYFDIPERLDIKVVTDGTSVGLDMIKYATILMPLTTKNKAKDASIRQRVWNICIEQGLNYTPRLHYEVWGPKRGV